MEESVPNAHSPARATALSQSAINNRQSRPRFTNSRCSQAITHSPRWLSTSSFSTTIPCSGRLCSRFSAGLGLVATNCVNAFSYGYDKLRFIKPVFIGDTIYTIKTDLEKSPKYPDMGLYRTSYEIFKNDGELVLYCEHIQTVKYRHPENFAP